jgi:hypothetical protein
MNRTTGSKVYQGRTAIWLIAAMLVLRSMIAPGYMLDIRGEGLGGLHITLCDGLNGALQSDGDHNAHAGHDTGLTSCGLWATSSTFNQTESLPHNSLLRFGPDEFNHSLPLLVSSQTIYRQHQPRAPPVSSIV